ncbi:hypothetical protein [Micromonospora sp. HUAS LYJ1]|uniref:hypothetical protein n=1 Tax=Micromonospora sp. HUAS LYJ1 TaxID=3061626 RepID=UPI002673FA44|nr:hypothetical protein [Micromonospora sp. HUAS LYJ1]WKU04211.1 hypothetical protein Q2K16_25855 [Micromonospora sp. HUAS LYJ1]
MPAVSTTLRVLAVSVIASLTVTGCQTLDDAGRTLGRADLINDLATRLDESLVRTWTAEYRLAGGRNFTIAQTKEPARSAYTWTAGKITVSEQAITRCGTAAGRTTCTVEPPVLMSGKAAVPLFAEARKAGLVTPPAVIGLLTEAALDPAAQVKQTDTTITGHHATCVEVRRAAGNFDTCVTSEGVLGSFTGVLDGQPVELTLDRYTDSVTPTAFDLPAGAGVTDRRPATS